MVLWNQCSGEPLSTPIKKNLQNLSLIKTRLYMYNL